MGEVAHESNVYISLEIIGPLHLSIPVVSVYPLQRQQKELEPKKGKRKREGVEKEMVAGYRKVMGPWQNLSPRTLLEKGVSSSYQTSSMLPTPVLSLGNVLI